MKLIYTFHTFIWELEEEGKRSVSSLFRQGYKEKRHITFVFQFYPLLTYKKNSGFDFLRA